MIPGPLIGAYRGLVAASEAVVTDIAQAVDRALDRFAGGPAVSEKMAAMAAVAQLNVEVQAVDADALHHGCWTFHVCGANNTVSVVRPTDGCLLCVSAPVEVDSAGDRPAAESAPPTPPAAGHPNPLLDAAAADRRIAKRLSRFLT